MNDKLNHKAAEQLAALDIKAAVQVALLDTKRIIAIDKVGKLFEINRLLEELNELLVINDYELATKLSKVIDEALEAL